MKMLKIGTTAKEFITWYGVSIPLNSIPAGGEAGI